MQHLRNSIQLIGRLGQDPVQRTFDSGRQLATFSLATSESYQNARGERVTDTQWHQVVAWGKLADIAAQYLSKGHEVLVAGKLVYRRYEDKQGQTRTKAEVHASSLLLLEPRQTPAS
jgi:single-strand DNA-binding protein